MSDGKNNHAGLLRTSMKEITDMLRTDAQMIENDVEITYRLDHPSKQIEDRVHRFRLAIEPAGFSQTAGQGRLDLQYYTWLLLKCKPHNLGVDEEDSLTFICEYLTDLLHKKMWGGMSTYISRVLLNFKSCEIQANHRSVSVKLAEDEIGAVIWMWQSPKTLQQIEEEGIGEYESATTVKIETGESAESAGSEEE